MTGVRVRFGGVKWGVKGGWGRRFCVLGVWVGGGEGVPGWQGGGIWQAGAGYFGASVRL